MDAELGHRLLASMEQDKLVVVCGAGLSMAPPSNVPSAVVVAGQCASRFGVDGPFVQKVALWTGSDSKVGVSCCFVHDLAAAKTRIPSLEVVTEATVHYLGADL